MNIPTTGAEAEPSSVSYRCGITFILFPWGKQATLVTRKKKKVPVFQCKLPPFWLLLLSQLCKSGLWILYNLISTVMPAETCSIGFVFASTVNRCDWSHTGTFPSYYRVILLFSLFGLKQDKTQILQSRTVSRITFLVNLAAYSVQPREQTIKCAHSPHNTEKKK